MVYEVDQNNNTVHLQSIGQPIEPPEFVPAPAAPDTGPPEWSEECATRLSTFLPEESVLKLKDLFLEGSTPPHDPLAEDIPEPSEYSGGRGRGRGGRGRGGRGRGRGGRRVVDTRKVVSPVSLLHVPLNTHHFQHYDLQPIASKDTRTEFHTAVRELFKGKLETETDSAMGTPSNPAEGSRIAVKWAGRGRGARAPQGGMFSLCSS